MSRTLHKTQVEMFAAIRDGVIDHPSRSRGIAIAPPGFGKTSVITACFDHIAAKNIQRGGKGVGLMLTPRLILNAQQAQELESITLDQFQNMRKSTITFDSSIPNGLSIDRITDFIETCHRTQQYPIVVSTYKSCARLAKLKFDIICCDEGHNVVSQRVFFSVMGGLDPNSKRIFITATPKFGVTNELNNDADSEDVELGDEVNEQSLQEVPVSIRRQSRGMQNTLMYGDIVFSLSFKDAVRQGLILPIKKVDLAGYGDVNVVEHTVDIIINSALQMKSELEGVNIPSKTLFALDRHNAGQQIFSIYSNWEDIKSATGCDVYTAFSKGEDFRKNGKKFYSGRDCPDVRHAFINDFAQNNNDAIIVHYGTLGEGVSVPSITATVLFPTDDVIRIIQNIGRAMRVLPEDRSKPRSERIKKHALIGMFSFNGENSSQKFQDGIAEALHQMSSSEFFKKYLTAVILDGAGGAGVITQDKEPVDQYSLDEFNSSDFEDLEVIENCGGDAIMDEVQRKDKTLLMQQMVSQAQEMADAEIVLLSKWL